MIYKIIIGFFIIIIVGIVLTGNGPLAVSTLTKTFNSFFNSSISDVEA